MSIKDTNFTQRAFLKSGNDCIHVVSEFYVKAFKSLMDVDPRTGEKGVDLIGRTYSSQKSEIINLIYGDMREHICEIENEILEFQSKGLTKEDIRIISSKMRRHFDRLKEIVSGEDLRRR